MSRGPDAAALLAQALTESARRSAVALDVRESRATRWASATFAGMRHAMTLAMPRSLDADTWLGEIEEVDLPLRGHLVADVTLVALRRDADGIVAEIEALTVEES